MLAIIVGSARIWHAIASISASTAEAIDLAILTLLDAALLASDRKADLIPATSELIINKG